MKMIRMFFTLAALLFLASAQPVWAGDEDMILKLSGLT